ncbi:helix-turn-helix domain-containing protein [Novosphingopyxis sp.]|uniref:helix-turn-helix domain-containing protein n=1 Tax=Novosphingopyxis sp. TaxID=2709690 RepID=UPI003B58CE30
MEKTKDDSADQRLALSFGRNVTRYREKRGFSMSELARRAGMSRAYVQRVEQGGTLANLRNIARLAAAMRVSVSSLTQGLDISDLNLSNRPYRSED